MFTLLRWPLATHSPRAGPRRVCCPVATVLGCALLLSACATSPIPKPLRQAAQGQPAFEIIRQNPDGYRGRTVVWGGTIVQTHNLPDLSEVEILQRPLDRSDDSPTDTDQSQGRFIARCPGFLDPSLYSKDRDVTVAGTVIGRESRPLGQTQYPYVLVTCEAIHLWPNRPSTPFYYYPPPWYGPWWWYGWPGFGPYWYPYW